MFALVLGQHLLTCVFVTHASSGSKPSMWSFPFAIDLADRKRGNDVSPMSIPSRWSWNHLRNSLQMNMVSRRRTKSPAIELNISWGISFMFPKQSLDNSVCFVGMSRLPTGRTVPYTAGYLSSRRYAFVTSGRAIGLLTVGKISRLAYSVPLTARV